MIPNDRLEYGQYWSFLDYHDPDYQLIIGARVVKSSVSLNK